MKKRILITNPICPKKFSKPVLKRVETGAEKESLKS